MENAEKLKKIEKLYYMMPRLLIQKKKASGKVIFLMYFHPKRYNVFSQKTVCFQFCPCREERLSDRWISVVKNKNIVVCSQNCKELGFGTGM